MKRIVIAMSAALAATVVAFAGPVEDREALMKERGKAVGVLSAIAKSQQPFDAAVVMAQLEALKANADKTDIDVLWAADAKGNTPDTAESSPKIWEDMAGFKAEEEAYKAAIVAAIAAPPTDAAGVSAAMAGIGKGCGSCHEGYRLAKQ